MKSWSSSFSRTSSASRSALRSVPTAVAGFTVGPSYAELLGDQLECIPVAVGPLPVDLPDDQVEPLEDRMAAPFFALRDVGDVHLDRRDASQVERVPDRPRVVSPGACIQDRGVADLRQAMEVLDEIALGVRLEERGLEIKLTGEALDLNLELREREVAVDVVIAAAEHVEIDAMHHLDSVASDRAHLSSSTTARTLSGSTSSPQRGSPGSESSTNPSPSRLCFLSRCIAVSTSSVLTDGSSETGSACEASRAWTSFRSPSASESRSAASRPRPTASPWR